MKPVNILGISAYYHDSAACLVRDGEIVAAAQEERFTRVKHDPDFPSHAVAYCLREGGHRLAGLDYVGFLRQALPQVRAPAARPTWPMRPGGFAPSSTAMPLWLKQKLWMRAATS